jgi:hypothetical protein
VVAIITSGEKKADKSDFKEDRFLQWSARNSLSGSLVFLGKEKNPSRNRMSEIVI